MPDVVTHICNPSVEVEALRQEDCCEFRTA